MKIFKYIIVVALLTGFAFTNEDFQNTVLRTISGTDRFEGFTDLGNWKAIATEDYVDANSSSQVIDAINDAVTTTAPSQNAVFDEFQKYVLGDDLASQTAGLGASLIGVNLSDPTKFFTETNVEAAILRLLNFEIDGINQTETGYAFSRRGVSDLQVVSHIKPITAADIGSSAGSYSLGWDELTGLTLYSDENNIWREKEGGLSDAAARVIVSDSLNFIKTNGANQYETKNNFGWRFTGNVRTSGIFGIGSVSTMPGPGGTSPEFGAVFDGTNFGIRTRSGLDNVDRLVYHPNRVERYLSSDLPLAPAGAVNRVLKEESGLPVEYLVTDTDTFSIITKEQIEIMLNDARPKYATALTGIQNMNLGTEAVPVAVTFTQERADANWTITANEASYTGQPDIVEVTFSVHVEGPGQRSTPCSLLEKWDGAAWISVDGANDCSYLRNGSGQDEDGMSFTYTDANPINDPKYRLRKYRGSTLTNVVNSTSGQFTLKAIN